MRRASFHIQPIGRSANRDATRCDDTFSAEKGQRAVGVVYHSDMEMGNYVPTVLSERYDYLIFINRSQALHPVALEYASRALPETYPSGV